MRGFFHLLGILLVIGIGTYFFAGNPVTETYVAAPRYVEPHETSVPKDDAATTEENAEELSGTVSKISETISNLKEQISAIPAKLPPPPSISPEEVNTQTRAALLNIYCTTTINGGTRLSTGSGVVIDPRGIILTNAHVADSFLFEGAPTFGNTDCIIRGGSPAAPLYDAELLYLSPSWVRGNAEIIKQENPLGTGENDFALLYITRSTKQGFPLPESFPFLSPEFDRDVISSGDSVLLASYPAGFLGSIAVQKDLYQTSTIANIDQLYTFETGTLDLFSIVGNVVAQKGSSGSGVVSLKTGKVLGIVVTSSEGATTADRELQAIVFAHMSESMKKDIGFTLEQYLSGNPAEEAASFANNISPTLLQILSQ